MKHKSITFKIAIIFVLALMSLSVPKQHARAEMICDFNALGAQSLLLANGFTDATANIMGNPAESQKARQVLANVQKIYLHPQSQSMAMFGWSDLPSDLSAEPQKKSLLAARLEKLKREAESQAYGFSYQMLPDNPPTAQFNTSYPAKTWPQREIGAEIIAGNNCYLTIRFGGNRLNNSAADSAITQLITQEIERYRDWIRSASTDKKVDLEMKPLPGFDSKNFWDIVIPTLIIAFVAGMIIARTAERRDDKHIAYFFRIMAALWFGYVLLLSLLKPYVIPVDYPLSLDHFVYAAIMIVINACGIIIGPVLILPSIALALAHALRTAIFLVLDITIAPKMIWFDVGLMTLMCLYILIFGFRRKSSLPRPHGSMPKVVDRS